MTIENIISQLKDGIDRDELIEKLEKELEKKNYTKHTSTKRLNAIKRVLNKNIVRPVLTAYTPNLGGGVTITDSYQLYVLNDTKLPFQVAFTESFDKETYIKDNNISKLEIIEGTYPNTSKLIPDDFDRITTIKINVNDVLRIEKTTPKDDSSKKLFTISNESITICFDLIFMKTAIEILQLKGDVELNIFGENRPITMHNEKGETGLILPIRKY